MRCRLCALTVSGVYAATSAKAAAQTSMAAMNAPHSHRLISSVCVWGRIRSFRPWRDNFRSQELSVPHRLRLSYFGCGALP